MVKFSMASVSELPMDIDLLKTLLLEDQYFLIEETKANCDVMTAKVVKKVYAPSRGRAYGGKNIGLKPKTVLLHVSGAVYGLGKSEDARLCRDKSRPGFTEERTDEYVPFPRKKLVHNQIWALRLRGLLGGVYLSGNRWGRTNQGEGAISIGAPSIPFNAIHSSNKGGTLYHPSYESVKPRRPGGADGPDDGASPVAVQRAVGEGVNV